MSQMVRVLHIFHDSRFGAPQGKNKQWTNSLGLFLEKRNILQSVPIEKCYKYFYRTLKQRAN